MARYAVRRLLHALLVLLGASVLVHVAMFVMPGDPIRPQFGVNTPDPEVLREARARWGLDEPWPVQYWRFLENLFTGDLGQSYRGWHVSTMIKAAYPVTLKVVLVAIGFQVVFGLWLGVRAARKPRGIVDRTVGLAGLLVLSVPVMVGAVLVSEALPWWQRIPGIGPVPPALKTVVLPGLMLALVSTVLIARLTRLGLRDELREAYAKVASAKGLPDSLVVMRHAFRNAVVPVVAFIGADIAAMTSTLPVIETAFYLDGLGARVVAAARNNDTAPLIAVVAIFVLVAVVASTFADLFAAALDPRRRDDTLAK